MHTHLCTDIDIEGVLGSQNLFSQSCSERPRTKGKPSFQTPLAILGPPVGHFGFCRQCSFAGPSVFAIHCNSILVMVSNS